MKVLYKELSEVIALTCWRCMEVRLVVFGYLLSVLYNLLSLRNSFDLDVLAWSYVRSLLCVMSDEGCEILNCWQFYLFLYFMRENIGFPFELLNSFINNIHGLTFFDTMIIIFLLGWGVLGFYYGPGGMVILYYWWPYYEIIWHFNDWFINALQVIREHNIKHCNYN